MNGCHSCPIRCHISTDFPELEQYGAFRYNENTCTGYSAISAMMSTVTGDSASSLRNQNMSTFLTHDYGFWTDYGGYAGTLTWAKTHVMTAQECTGIGLPASYVGKTPLQNRIPAAELTILTGSATGVKQTAGADIGKYVAGTPFRLADDGNPQALVELMKLICLKSTTTPTYQDVVANGTTRWAEKWPEIEFASEHCKSLTHFKFGYEKHHGVETFGQVGMLINLFYNRDPMNHSHCNQGVGPPAAIREAIMKELFSSAANKYGSIFNDPAGSDVGIVNSANPTGYSAMTKGKAAFAAASLIDVELKNSLIECDWTFPLWMSPLKRLNYRGDPTVSAQAYTAVTGDPMTWAGLQTIGLRIFTLFRCINARIMDYEEKKVNAAASVNMRVDHDAPAPWHFEKIGTSVTADNLNITTGNTNSYPATDVAFTGTTQLMTIADMDIAKSMIYAMFGWDDTTGMPTRTTLTYLGLDFVLQDAKVAALCKTGAGPTGLP
jgi:aldehyde:ferredoxin oxidoreductase